MTTSKTILAQLVIASCSYFLLPAPYAMATDSSDAKDAIEKVMVTGSRIPRANLSKPGAVTTVTRMEIEQAGFKNVGDYLQNLTVAASSPNSLNNNNAAGVTGFDLRGLGAQRTLVLLNNKRLPNGGNGADAAVDLSAIPTAIIERVEILLDGASSVYGSDAVSGVVNIITRVADDLFEVKAETSRSAENDANSLSLELVTGIISDKGRFLVSASYDEKDAVYAGARSFSAVDYTLNKDGSRGKGGSSALPWSNLKVTNANGDDIMVTRGPEFGEWRETITDSSLAKNDLYNYQEPSFLQTPFERYSMSAFGEYDLGDFTWGEAVKFNFEALYSHRKSTTNGAPQPLVPVWGGYFDFTYSPDNYYNQMYGPKDVNGNPFAINDWRRRMVETNGRMNYVENSQYRVVLALSGELAEDWQWEVAYNFARNSNKRLKTGIFNWPAVKNAVGPTHFDAQGTLRCGANADALIAGCVPLNIFGQPGTETEITKEMLEYISGDWPGLQMGHNQIKVASANISGTVANLPAGEVGVSLGIEHQKVEAINQTDAVSINILVTDGLGRPTGGDYALSEAYFEAVIPLVANEAWAKSLELNIASRYSDFDTFGSTTNSKVGLLWGINDELTIRSTWSEAFRAPNIVELYKGKLPGFENGADPCAIATPNQNCINTGVPADGSYRETIGQLRTNTGGNTELQPETATSTTIGLIYQPSWLDSASLTFDYYRISLDQLIGTISAVTKVQECMNYGRFCESIHRVRSGEFQGTLTGIDVFSENLSKLDRAGLDAELRLSLGDYSFGSLSSVVNWSYIASHELAMPSVPTRDLVGERLNGQHAIPKHRVNLALNLNTDDYKLVWNSFYIGEMTELDKAKGGSLSGFDHVISSTLTHNVNASYYLSDTVEIAFGINNITDKTPPFATGNGNNADPIHSALFLGREYRLGVSMKF